MQESQNASRVKTGREGQVKATIDFVEATFRLFPGVWMELIYSCGDHDEIIAMRLHGSEYEVGHLYFRSSVDWNSCQGLEWFLVPATELRKKLEELIDGKKLIYTEASHFGGARFGIEVKEKFIPLDNNQINEEIIPN